MPRLPAGWMRVGVESLCARGGTRPSRDGWWHWCKWRGLLLRHVYCLGGRLYRGQQRGQRASGSPLQKRGAADLEGPLLGLLQGRRRRRRLQRGRRGSERRPGSAAATGFRSCGRCQREETSSSPWCCSDALLGDARCLSVFGRRYRGALLLAVQSVTLLGGRGRRELLADELQVPPLLRSIYIYTLMSKVQRKMRGLRYNEAADPSSAEQLPPFPPLPHSAEMTAAPN